jgi:hypothetical protein
MTTMTMVAPIASWPSAFALIPHSVTDNLSDIASLFRGAKRHRAAIDRVPEESESYGVRSETFGISSRRQMGFSTNLI